MHVVGIQRHTETVMPKNFQQVTAFPAEDVQITGKRLCDASHNRLYVSSAIMWRRRRVLSDFAATGGLGRHII